MDYSEQGIHLFVAVTLLTGDSFYYERQVSCMLNWIYPGLTLFFTSLFGERLGFGVVGPLSLLYLYGVRVQLTYQQAEFDKDRESYRFKVMWDPNGWEYMPISEKMVSIILFVGVILFLAYSHS
jgi:hypothetical protein